jgi:hypothetical protein
MDDCSLVTGDPEFENGALRIDMMAGARASTHAESPNGLALAEALQDQAFALAHRIAEGVFSADDRVAGPAEHMVA